MLTLKLLGSESAVHKNEKVKSPLRGCIFESKVVCKTNLFFSNFSPRPSDPTIPNVRPATSYERGWPSYFIVVRRRKNDLHVTYVIHNLECASNPRLDRIRLKVRVESTERPSPSS
jgi:hypothetical protein